VSGLAVSISLLVAAFVAVIVGTVLPPDLALWGIVLAGALLVASVVAFVVTLVRLRRRS
jgi:hypothetical protein